MLEKVKNRYLCIANIHKCKPLNQYLFAIGKVKINKVIIMGRVVYVVRRDGFTLLRIDDGTAEISVFYPDPKLENSPQYQEYLYNKMVNQFQNTALGPKIEKYISCSKKIDINIGDRIQVFGFLKIFRNEIEIRALDINLIKYLEDEMHFFVLQLKFMKLLVNERDCNRENVNKFRHHDHKLTMKDLVETLYQQSENLLDQSSILKIISNHSSNPSYILNNLSRSNKNLIDINKFKEAEQLKLLTSETNNLFSNNIRSNNSKLSPTNQVDPLSSYDMLENCQDYNIVGMNAENKLKYVNSSKNLYLPNIETNIDNEEKQFNRCQLKPSNKAIKMLTQSFTDNNFQNENSHLFLLNSFLPDMVKDSYLSSGGSLSQRLSASSFMDIFSETSSYSPIIPICKPFRIHQDHSIPISEELNKFVVTEAESKKLKYMITKTKNLIKNRNTTENLITIKNNVKDIYYNQNAPKIKIDCLNLLEFIHYLNTITEINNLSNNKDIEDLDKIKIDNKIPKISLKFNGFEIKNSDINSFCNNFIKDLFKIIGAIYENNKNKNPTQLNDINKTERKYYALKCVKKLLNMINSYITTSSRIDTFFQNTTICKLMDILVLKPSFQQSLSEIIHIDSDHLMDIGLLNEISIYKYHNKLYSKKKIADCINIYLPIYSDNEFVQLLSENTQINPERSFIVTRLNNDIYNIMNNTLLETQSLISKNKNMIFEREKNSTLNFLEMDEDYYKVPKLDLLECEHFHQINDEEIKELFLSHRYETYQNWRLYTRWSTVTKSRHLIPKDKLSILWASGLIYMHPKHGLSLSYFDKSMRIQINRTMFEMLTKQKSDMLYFWHILNFVRKSLWPRRLTINVFKFHLKILERAGNIIKIKKWYYMPIAKL